MANRIKLAGTTVPSFKVGLNGATISSEAVTSPYSLVLPPELGTDGQALVLDANGNLVFADAGGGSTGNITFDGNKIIGDGTMSLVPDVNQQANDRYVIVDPTSEGLVLRTGGTENNSAADLLVGSPNNRLVVSDDNGTARLENNQFTDTGSYTLDSTTFSTAVWSAGQIAFNDATQAVLDAIWASDNVSLIEITDGNNWWTVTSNGSSTPGPEQTNTLYVDQNPPDGDVQLTVVNITTRTNALTYVQVGSRDVRIQANDDIRIEGNDVFDLRNYSSSDPIRIITDYGDNEYTWEFQSDGTLRLPQNGDIIDQNGQSVLGGSSSLSNGSASMTMNENAVFSIDGYLSPQMGLPVTMAFTGDSVLIGNDMGTGPVPISGNFQYVGIHPEIGEPYIEITNVNGTLQHGMTVNGGGWVNATIDDTDGQTYVYISQAPETPPQPGDIINVTGFSQIHYNRVAIGTMAGKTNQADYTVAIGYNSGGSNQGSDAVAIGLHAAANDQSVAAVAVGPSAGSQNQGYAAVALGSGAGGDQQGAGAISIGFATGSSNQKQYAIALGSSSGQVNQGEHAIAIGRYAGVSNQGNNSIVINATGSTLNNTTANSFVVSPIRQGNTTQVLYYNTTSKEITYSDAPGGGGSVSPSSEGGTGVIQYYDPSFTSTGGFASSNTVILSQVHSPTGTALLNLGNSVTGGATTIIGSTREGRGAVPVAIFNLVEPGGATISMRSAAGNFPSSNISLANPSGAIIDLSTNSNNVSTITVTGGAGSGITTPSLTVSGNTTLNGDLSLKSFTEARSGGTIPGILTVDPQVATMYYFNVNQNFTFNGFNTLSNNAGRSVTIVFKQDSTGGRVMTSNSNILWAGGQKTLSTAPNAIDIVTIMFDGMTIQYYASLVKGFA